MKEVLQESRRVLAQRDAEWHARFDKANSATAADYQPSSDGIRSEMDGEVIVGDDATEFKKLADESPAKFRSYSGKSRAFPKNSEGSEIPEDALRMDPNRLAEVGH